MKERIMRVPKEQLDFLKDQVKKYLPEAKVYLFGSRADDQKKGGDIDILILGNSLLAREQKWKIKADFCKKFGDQKTDIVSFTFDDESNFKQLILMDAIEL